MRAISLAMVLCAIGCGEAPKTKSATATLESRSMSTVAGTALFTVSGTMVTFKYDVTGATPGVHGSHIHDIGDCSAADGMSAGGHWNPTMMDHGAFAATPHHAGDLGNLTVGEDGKATLTMTTDQWTVGTGAANDVVNHAIIFHGGTDDFMTQPTGNAGNRQACGKITLVP